NTSFIATTSATSPLTVAVPCVLTAPTSRGLIPLPSMALRMLLAACAPVGSGITMSKPSELVPNPTISARTRARRASAWSSASSTTIPAPVRDRRARRAGHAFQHDKRAELCNLSGIELSPCRIGGFHASDSCPDDARRSVGLQVDLGKPGIADGIERGEAAVFGCFRNCGTQFSRDGRALELCFDVQDRARHPALQAQAFPLPHCAAAACPVLESPHHLAVIVPKARYETDSRDRHASRSH